jgi:hypothetical protein
VQDGRPAERQAHRRLRPGRLLPADLKPAVAVLTQPVPTVVIDAQPARVRSARSWADHSAPHSALDVPEAERSGQWRRSAASEPRVALAVRMAADRPNRHQPAGRDSPETPVPAGLLAAWPRNRPLEPMAAAEPRLA